jgi:hypothetical protein
MTEITREQLHAYLDDALADAETAQIEHALRASDELRKLLRAVMQERDRGEHTLGAIWRRERLSCPTREQLGSFLLQVLEPDLHTYIEFHIQTVGCAPCRANLADLETLRQEPPAHAESRRRRFYQSSAGLLSGKRVK